MGTSSSRDQPRRISFENQVVMSSNNFPVPCEPIAEEIFVPPNSSFENPSKKYPDKEIISTVKENYWANRLDWLHKAHNNINYILEREREKAFAQTNEMFKSKFTQKSQAADCQKYKAKIISCYNDHPGEPLACSDLVKSFNEFVTNVYCEED